MLLDTHCHLNFLPDAGVQQVFLTEMEKQGVGVVAQTVLPSEFEQGVENRWSSVGYHPWFLIHGVVGRELEIFEQALESTRFVGEVGLDFSPRGLERASRDEQVAVFRRIVSLCASQPEPVVMSIHSVRAAETVLDILEQDGGTQQQIIPVFHWFSDGGAALNRLLKRGAYLSLNQRMLATKRGKAYARQLPGKSILLETDMPAEPLTTLEKTVEELAQEHADQLATTLKELNSIRGTDTLPQFLANQQKIYFDL